MLWKQHVLVYFSFSDHKHLCKKLYISIRIILFCKALKDWVVTKAICIRWSKWWNMALDKIARVKLTICYLFFLLSNIVTIWHFLNLKRGRHTWDEQNVSNISIFPLKGSDSLRNESAVYSVWTLTLLIVWVDCLYYCVHRLTKMGVIYKLT